ncbi:MAG: alpha/beta hydrolase [Deltaproteobacteria bacterium]|nr:alpha/beta hydrolase [Deltaproteobacteria bacterium]
MSTRTPTILIHGLWFRSPVMWALGRDLEKIGLDVRYYNYSTTRAPTSASIERLAELIDRAGPRVNIVGHSMGGLLAIEAAHVSKAGAGTIVALGSPFQGSAAARWVARSKIGSGLLGHAADFFEHEFQLPNQERWKVGIIAGSTGMGLGTLTRVLSGAHDGTVTVEEASLPGASKLVVPASHTSMLWSSHVKEQLKQFLTAGEFRSSAS